MDYAQQYIDIGMFHTDPEDRDRDLILQDYLGGRKAVFCTAVTTVDTTELADSGDELGMMPFISRNGRKNLYMYSPSSYIGISRRLAEPGNERKLEDAVKLLSLLFSQEGQSVLITEQTPCVLSVLDSQAVPEDALVYDTQQALWDGRAFPMTGAQARELAAAGFDLAGDGDPYPYVLVTRGGGELEDDQTYRVAFLMGGYTEEAGKAYHAQVTAGYVRDILRDWLAEQKAVSPDEIRWE